MAAGTGQPASTKVTIAVLTYRRPADLPVIVPQLFAQIDECTVDAEVDVLVIDNDAEGSAEATLRELARPGLRWVVEPTPGIAAARNRALDECRSRDLVIFIDDDESPHPGWLTALLEQQASTGAAAVAGAVVSEFDGDLDPWIVDGGFFRRIRPKTGTRVEVAATNNLLLDLSVVRSTGVRFDERFGLSGGSDSLFTRNLVARGGAIIWCDEAVVSDRVPAARTTRSWVVRRWFRMGNTWSLAMLAVDPAPSPRWRMRGRLVGQGALRCVGGTAELVAGALLRSRRQRANGRRVLARGTGMVLGAVGYRYSEYRRG